ncbi:MAG: hypothetical protein ACYCYM_12900 [Saccharofermentanales bacterium]
MALLLLSLLLGYLLVRFCFRIENFMMQLAGSFLIGSLFSGTFLYLMDLLMISAFGNRWAANVIYSIAALGVSALLIYRNRNAFAFRAGFDALSEDSVSLVVIITSLWYSLWMNYYTFYTDKGNIVLRGGAWSDIMYHHAFIRSISLGANVPTTYPYFADTEIHYHFMFNYFGGKLAQFGMSTINALNITSALGFAAMLILLFELGRTYFRSNAVGVLTALFMVLHSSAAAFKWAYGHSIAETLQKSGWLKDVNYEGWGLFNFNVFVNQRHFAFGLAFCVFVVLFMILKAKEMPEKDDSTGIRGSLKWKALGPFVLLGLSIGIFPYWNVIVASICIGFIGLHAISEFNLNRSYSYRMLAAALIAVVLVLPQLLMFKSGDTVLTGYPMFQPGYEIQNFGLLTFLSYYYKVLGVKFLLILAAVFFIDQNKRGDYLIFLIPFTMANIWQFGKVQYDNNKLMIISLMFANMFAAYLIVRIYQLAGQWAKKFGNGKPDGLARLSGVFKGIAVVLTISVILAGVIDLYALKNMGKINIKDSDSSLRSWIVDNTEPDAIFLTGNFIPYGDNAITGVTLSGRMLYCVRNDVDSSVDIAARMANIPRIYTFADGLEETITLIRKENIDYILIDSVLRSTTEFKVNEAMFSSNFQLEYTGRNEYEGQDVYVYSLK